TDTNTLFFNVVVVISGFCTSTFHCKNALRALLNESNDEDKYCDLGQYGASPAFEELVKNAQAQRGIHGASQLAHSAQHHDHERIHDVALAQIRPYVADLAECATGQARNAA